jgi:hypothetical protein
MPSAGAIVTTAEEEIIYTGVLFNTPSTGLTTLTGLQRGIHGTTPAAVSVLQGNMMGVVSEMSAGSTSPVLWQISNTGESSFGTQLNPGIGPNVLANYLYAISNFTAGYLPSANGISTNPYGTFIPQPAASSTASGYLSSTDWTTFNRGGGGGNVPWTPTDQSGAGLIFTNVHVGSSRIGNMVFVYGSFSISITSDTNYVQIGGLPVTTPSNCFFPVGNAVYYYTSQTMAQVWPYSNSNNFTLYSTSGSVSQVTNNLLSGQTLYFSFSYPVSF